MWIWNVVLEIEWSYNKGEWEECSFAVAAPSADKAEEKARKICAKQNKAWSSVDDDNIVKFYNVTNTRLVSIVRVEEIDA